MKKILTLLLSAALIFSLSACGSGKIPGFEEDNGGDRPAGTGESDNTQSSGEDGEEIQGFVGDTLSTAFFDFRVDDVEEVESYGDYTPADGNMLVVAHLTIHNTQTCTNPMYDNDFALWVDADQAYTTATMGTLCTDYELAINQEVSGDLVFEVTRAARDCSLDFMEIFSDETYGDSYAVYFTLSGSGIQTPSNGVAA